jgi:hypothetical protein
MAGRNLAENTAMPVKANFSSVVMKRVEPNDIVILWIQAKFPDR